MAISGTTDRPLEMGARNSNAKIETYTIPGLDQAKTPFGRVVDYEGIEHSGEWSRKTVVAGCHNESMHETGLRSFFRPTSENTIMMAGETID
ncbi:UNVERIFIED_CONTAM: hypothetical protein Sindi_2942500 [Sesamum indicum]